MTIDEPIIFNQYSVFLKAVQDPEENGVYRYMITIFEEDEENPKPRIEIPSMATYSDYRMAIFDGNGVLELLGFNLDGEIHTLFVLKWDAEKQEYKTEPLRFDGVDFFPTEEKGEEE